MEEVECVGKTVSVAESSKEKLKAELLLRGYEVMKGGKAQAKRREKSNSHQQAMSWQLG